MFAMGDRVVYPLHGGAIIKDIEAHIHDGETVKYYILQMLFDNMTVSVPVENAEKLGLRYIGDDETLAIIQNTLHEVPDDSEGDFLESALSVVYAEDKKRQCC